MRTDCVDLVLTISGMAAGGTAPKRVLDAAVPDEYTATSVFIEEPVYVMDFRFDSERIRAVTPRTASRI
jgi:hypothetical protein